MASEELKTLTKKQFCKTVDNYVKTLLKTQTAKNRADIVKCIEQLQGVKSVKQSKEFLSVVLSNGKTHRLKGDFYHEQFEIGLYSQRLRAAAESRATADELAAALRQTLINFEKLIGKSEQPIIDSTTLLHRVQEKTTALELHLNSILEEIGNLSPQAIQILTASYMEQIEELQAKLASIDITEISKVKSSIDSFSTSIQALQSKINNQLQSISIDQKSIQAQVQGQVTASDSQRKRGRSRAKYRR